MGPEIRNDLNTGDEAIVEEARRECRYALSVSLFFSLAKRFGEKAVLVGDPEYPFWNPFPESAVGEVGGAATYVRSLAGGGRTSSSG